MPRGLEPPNTTQHSEHNATINTLPLTIHDIRPAIFSFKRSHWSHCHRLINIKQISQPCGHPTVQPFRISSNDRQPRQHVRQSNLRIRSFEKLEATHYQFRLVWVENGNWRIANARSWPSCPRSLLQSRSIAWMKIFQSKGSWGLILRAVRLPLVEATVNGEDGCWLDAFCEGRYL
jgi:hypothetical protein